MRPVKSLALQILDAACTVRSVEKHTGDEGVRDDAQLIRESAGYIENSFARARSSVVARRERKVADPRRVTLDQTPVIRIEPAFEEPAHTRHLLAVFGKCLEAGIDNRRGQRTIPQQRY